MRQTQTIAQIKTEHPHAAFWILISPGGSSFILKRTDPEPEGRYYILGSYEK